MQDTLTEHHISWLHLRHPVPHFSALQRMHKESSDSEPEKVEPENLLSMLTNEVKVTWKKLEEFRDGDFLAEISGTTADHGSAWDRKHSWNLIRCRISTNGFITETLKSVWHQRCFTCFTFLKYFSCRICNHTVSLYRFLWRSVARNCFTLRLRLQYF